MSLKTYREFSRQSSDSLLIDFDIPYAPSLSGGVTAVITLHLPQLQPPQMMM